jgi:hypothetical protein
LSDNIYDLSGANIQHTQFTNAMEAVKTAMLPPHSPPSIIVCGPPKVGMTKLRQELAKQMYRGASGLESTPVVDIELSLALANCIGSLEVQFHRMMLAQLKDPYFAAKTVRYEQQGLFGSYDPLIRKFDSRCLEDLRRLTMLRLQSEQCKAVFVGMRQSITEVHRLRLVENSVRYIQDIAQDSGIPFVVFGNYDLVRNEEFLAEITDKSQLIHFPRYKLPQDRASFVQTLQLFEKSLLISSDIDFTDEATIKFLYTQSLGCVGRLIELFQKALKTTANNKTKVLRTEALEANQGLPRAVTRISEYIKLGEKMLTQRDEEWAGLCQEVERDYYAGVEPVTSSGGDCGHESHVA